MTIFKIITILMLLFLCACKANLDSDSLAILYTKPGFDSGTRPHINNILYPDQYHPNMAQAPQSYEQAPSQPPQQQQPQGSPPMSRNYSNPYAIPPSYYQGYDSDKYYILPNYYNGGDPHAVPRH